jgi:Ni/Fe-hydrogenase subunit HybB-like protein
MAIKLGDIRLRRYKVGPGMIFIWIVGALGLAVAAWRWVVGLGPTTNLSDHRGWGIWISFDMMAGIGLAAGAFTLAAVVYIFNLKKFYPLVRPTILTGFISYILAALTLLADLGFPLRIWHLMIYGNIHSPLFEIGWCVMLYLGVLLLEFSPIVFEALHWKVPLKIIHGIEIPLMIAGITLSTLHQSTLGTMLTILPYRIHPLWYTPLLPVFYYISAIAAGLGMVVFESYNSARTYGYRFELKLLSSLTKAVPWLLGLYLVLKIGDLVVSGDYVYLLKGDLASVLYIIEIMGGVVVPMLMFADPKTRNTSNGIIWAAFYVMGGLIMNRINSALTFFHGALYLPAWSEIAVSVGLTCLGIIMFDAAVRFLPMFPEPTAEVSEK